MFSKMFSMFDWNSIVTFVKKCDLNGCCYVSLRVAYVLAAISDFLANMTAAVVDKFFMQESYILLMLIS